MEREGEEEHEGAKGGVCLKVNMDVVAAALQLRARSMAVPVSVSISAVRYQWRPLILRTRHLSTVQDYPLQNEDCEEAGSYDELWKRETGLFQTDTERLISLQAVHHKVRSQGEEIAPEGVFIV